MTHRRTTFSKFIIEDERRRTEPDPELTGLLNDIQTGCKFIAAAVSRGMLAANAEASAAELAKEIMLAECASSAVLCASAGNGSSDLVHPAQPLGRYLVVCDALDGVANLDVNVPVGTVFAVLRAPQSDRSPKIGDFLQAGTQQVAAGYAVYGPVAMIVVSLGAGVHGFTLDRDIGAYTLTHPSMRIPEETREFAIDASNERFWDAPVRHYVEECVQGKEGARGDDFHMRWGGSLVAEVHRILIRGGLFIYPGGTKDLVVPNKPRLLHDANPMAMIVEQAGGLASTGRERILEIAPDSPQQCVAVVLGSRREAERVVGYHATHDRGEDLAFETPLFNARSLFRAG